MALTTDRWIAFALNYVDRQMVYWMFPALKSDLGISNASLGHTRCARHLYIPEPSIYSRNQWR